MSEIETAPLADELMEGLFGQGLAERRRWPRQKSTGARVLVADRTMLNFWDGIVLDCSPEGLGLKLLGPKPAVGSLLHVCLAGEAKLNASIPVQIVRCQWHGRDRYLVGCSFLEPPPPETLVLFG
jgi:hypothetical protein